MVGSLLLLVNGLRPDISFTVNQVAKNCCDLHTANWNACKRILRYLSATKDYGILYSSMSPDIIIKNMTNMPLPTAYFDSIDDCDSYRGWILAKTTVVLKEALVSLMSLVIMVILNELINNMEYIET